MHSEQVKIVLDKLDIFTNKHINVQLSKSRQKKIQKLLEKDVFKDVTLDKVIVLEEVPSSIQVFNSSLVNNIKDLCIDKAYKKNRPVVHTYNDEKKNLVVMHLSQIPEVNQSIGSYFTAIIWDNDNNNIRFYLWDIMQTYIKITLDLNPNFYIRPFSKLLL